MSWLPATREEVEMRAAGELPACDRELARWFEQIRVEAFAVPIVRQGNTETVIAIARAAGHVIYFEDVEEGFNFSALDASGRIEQPGYEQWQLQHVLWQLRDHLRRTQPGASP